MGGFGALAFRRALFATAFFGGLVAPSIAAAQDGLVVQPAIPQGFDRDRNVSVLSRARPSYTALGVSVGGLLFYPEVETGAGATSNAYLTERDRTEAAFVSVEPSLRVASIWSRHSIGLNASVARRDYIGQSRRNERTWNLQANSEVELGRAFSISAEAQSSREIENQFSGEVTSTIAALSRLRRDRASVRAEYVSGRVRIFGVADHAEFRFSPVPLQDGGFRDQSNRNREVSRVTAQFEYARTPTVSLFAQAGYVDTVFKRRQSLASPLNSGAVRALVGANIDLAGRARGTIGVGYSIRDYRNSQFGRVEGVAIEGRLELFPSERLTITTRARRTVEDSTFGDLDPRPFWENRASLRGDYELLHNLILSGTIDYSRQTFIDREQRNSVYRFGGLGRFLASRRLTLEGEVSFAQRRSSGVELRAEPGEARIQAGLNFHI